jgi:hypothetical protein
MVKECNMHDSWPYAQRVFHFSGGILGVCAPHCEDVSIFPPCTNGINIVERIPSYSDISPLLGKYGILIGIEYCTYEEQFSGAYPADWRVYTNGQIVNYFALCQRLTKIRANAIKNKDLEFIGRIEKVSAWTTATARALRAISESYQKVLHARFKSKSFAQNSPFDDPNVDFIYDSLHNFFYYSGTLRDHIAEFIIFCIGETFPSWVTDDPKMSRLKTFLKKPKDAYSEQLHTIKQRIYDCYDPNVASQVYPGWLFFLKEYRNKITHEKPIDSIDCRAWVWQIWRDTPAGNIPSIKFPIPKRPDGPKNIVISRSPSEDFLLNNPDGLDIAWSIYFELLIFLNFILDFSKYSPIPVRIEAHQIISVSR